MSATCTWRSLALADGAEDVHHPHRQIAVLALQPDPLLGVAWPEVIERNPMLRLFGLFAVDRLDLEERQVALPFLGRPDLAQDRVSGPQIEALDLARTDVDIVGTVEVVPVGAAQEAVAFREDFEHPLAAQHRIGVEQRLLDAKDQVLLSEPRVVLNIEALGHRVQFRDGLLLQLGDIHVCGNSVGLRRGGKPVAGVVNALIYGSVRVVPGVQRLS